VSSLKVRWMSLLAVLHLAGSYTGQAEAQNEDRPDSHLVDHRQADSHILVVRSRSPLAVILYGLWTCAGPAPPLTSSNHCHMLASCGALLYPAPSLSPSPGLGLDLVPSSHHPCDHRLNLNGFCLCVDRASCHRLTQTGPSCSTSTNETCTFRPLHCHYLYVSSSSSHYRPAAGHLPPLRTCHHRPNACPAAYDHNPTPHSHSHSPHTC
jgi:hypothetical protein